MRLILQYAIMGCFALVGLARASSLDSGAELLYTFTPERCAEDSITATDLSNPAELIRNMDTTMCAPTLGVMSLANQTMSSSTINDNAYGLLSSWTSKDQFPGLMAEKERIGFELWFKTGEVAADAELRPILSIGQQGSDEIPLDISVCSKHGVDLLLGIRAGILVLYYRATSAILEPCRELRYRTPLEPHRLVHVLATLENEKQQLFVNGQGPLTNSDLFSSELTQWDPDYRLILLNSPSFSATPWQGTIYQLSISSRAATLSDVQSRLQEGLDSTPPYALNYNVMLHEDAEAIPESHTADWYTESPSIDEAERIDLSIGSVQREVNILLESVGLASSTSAAPPIYTFITELPDKGCMFRVDGYKLGCANETSKGPAEFLFVGTSFGDASQVIYIPPLNEYSNSPNQAFTTIRYCVSDGLIFQSSRCLSGSIHLIIQPVNDPPIALPVATVTVREGLETINTPRIMLSGTDVDTNDAIYQVQITKPPKYGYLISSVSSFRQDGLVHGIKLSDHGYMIRGTDPVVVKYVYQSTGIKAVVRDDEINDSFQFRVADRQGVWSGEEKVTIQVVSAVDALADGQISIKEDSTSTMNLLWFANDTSGYNRRLRFLAESLPPFDIGVLKDGLTGQIITQGSLAGPVMQSPYDGGAPFTFIPSANYCNSGDGEADEWPVLFRAVAFDEAHRVVSISARRKQLLRIECLTDALFLSLPTDHYAIRACQLPASLNTPCYGHVFDPSITETCGDNFVIIGGIVVESKDIGAQPVRVAVTTRVGYISFNQHAWNVTTPIHGRRSLTKNITFEALPSDLSDIFASIHYQALTAGPDAIDITLRYGSCLTLAEDSVPLRPMLTPDCQIIHRRIIVNVAESNDNRWPTKRIGSSFPWQILICWLGYPTAYYGFIRLDVRWIDSTDGEDDDDETIANEEVPPLWAQYVSENGDCYYQNTENGAVTWLAPVGETFIPWASLRKSDSEEVT